MSKLSKQIRKYISCPELGDEHYGKWGILTLEQRKNIAQLCEEINAVEEYIKNQMLGVKDSTDCLYKYILIKVKDYIKLKEQNEQLKHQLTEKDRLIEELQSQNKELLEGAKQMLYEGKEAMKNIRSMSGGNAMTVFKQNVLLDLYEQEIRHQVCEEIRASIKNSAIIITDNTLTQKERQLIKDQFKSDKETFCDILDQIEQGEGK